MPSLAEEYELLTGHKPAPPVDLDQAHPRYVLQVALTGKPIADVQADALEAARRADQARTHGAFAGDAVSRFAERAMGGFRPGGESASEFLGREVVPLAKGRFEERYREAKGRYDKAQASDEDLGLIVRYEAIKKTEEEEGTGRAVMRGLANVPKILVEATAGGRAVAAGKAALGLGRVATAAGEAAPLLSRAGAREAVKAAPGALAAGAAATPLIPDLYYADAQQRATRNGGNWYDAQNIAPAAAYAVLQSAVLGHAQRVAGGATPTVLGRAGVGGAVGLAEQQAGDAAASLVDDFLIGDPKYKVGQEYGAFYRALKGKPGAEKELATQIATFALFSALQGPKPVRTSPDAGPAPAAPPAYTLAPLVAAADEAKAAAAAKLVPKEKVAVELAAVGRRFEELLKADPATAWDAARELYREEQEAKGTRWTRPYEKAVAAVVLKAKAAEAKPAAPEQAAPVPSAEPAVPAEDRAAAPAADPYAGWSDADLRDFARGFDPSFKNKSRAKAVEKLTEMGVTPGVLADFGKPRQDAPLYANAPPAEPSPTDPGVRPDDPAPAPAPETAAQEAPGRTIAPEAPEARPTQEVASEGKPGPISGNKAVRFGDPLPLDGMGFIRGSDIEVAARYALTKYGGKGSQILYVPLEGPGGKIGDAILVAEDIGDGRQKVHVPWLGETGKAGGEGRFGKGSIGSRGLFDLLGEIIEAFPAAESVAWVPSAGRLAAGQQRLYTREQIQKAVARRAAPPPAEPAPAQEPAPAVGRNLLGEPLPQAFRSKKSVQPTIEDAAREAGDRVAEEWAAERGLAIDRRSASGWFEAGGKRYVVERHDVLDETSPLVVKPATDDAPAMKGLKKKAAAKDETLAGVVRRYGGIANDSEFKKYFGTPNEASQYGFPLNALRTGGRGIDSLAQELHAAGYLRSADPQELIDGLSGRRLADPESLAAAERAEAEDVASRQAEAEQKQIDAIDDFLAPDEPAAAPEALTEREQMVLDLRREGQSFRKIGKIIGVSYETVRLIEKAALARQGQFESIEKAEHAPSRAERGADLGGVGRAAELTREGEVAPVRESVLVKRQRKIEAEMEKLSNQFLEAADRAKAEGKASEETQRLVDRYEALHQEYGALSAELAEAERRTRAAGLPAPPVRQVTRGGIPGMPGDTPEFGVPPDPARYAMAMAEVRKERLARGRAEMVAASIRRSDRELWDKAHALLRADPQFADRLVERVETEGYLPDPDSGEVTALLLKRTALGNEYAEAERRLNQAQAVTWDGQQFRPTTDPAEVDRLRTRVDELRLQRDRLDDLTRQMTGAKYARALRLWRLVAKEDYTLDGLLRSGEAAKGRPLDDAEKAKLIAASEKLAAAEADLRAAEPGAAGLEPAAGPDVTGEKVVDLSATGGLAMSRGRGGSGPGLTGAGGRGGDLADLRIAVKKARAGAASELAALRDKRPKTRAQKATGFLAKANDLFRALQTSFDIGHVFRQGGFLAYGRPVTAAKGLLPATLKSFGSERAFDRGQDAIEQRANFPLYKRAGLPLTGLAGSGAAHEEGYGSTLAHRVPGVRASERAYVGGLNRLRADAFDLFAATLTRDGKPTDAELKWLGRFVGTITGRGSLKSPAWDAFLGKTSWGLFSPRYLLSRLQLAAGQPVWSAPTWRTRKLAAAEYARAAIGLSAVYALAAMLNDDERITFDPRSSDFGKIRFGNTRLDPMAGLAQIAVFSSRLATGETVDQHGRVQDLRRDVFGLTPRRPRAASDTGDVMWRFLRTKMAPLPQAVVSVLTGKDPVGQPIRPLPSPKELGEMADSGAVPRQSVASSLVLPFGPRDVYEAMLDQGMPRSAALALLAILGMGAQVYEPKKKAG